MANQTELLDVSDEMKLDKDRQNLCEEPSAEELYSSSLDTPKELCSSSDTTHVETVVCLSQGVSPAWNVSDAHG